MASLKDKSNKLLLGVVNNKTMEDAKNDDRVVDIDTLRQFTIPKMRKAKHELLENVSTDSVQFQREILQVLQQSFHDRKSTDRFVYSQPRLVHNAPLLNEFLEKRKAMRQDRTDKELPDTYGFIAVKSESEAKKYCAEGISIGNSSMMCLGNPAMGVYLCKHADILQPTQLFDGQSGYIVIFKIIKGKTKLMVENRVGEPLDPTPDFDCHLSKNVNVDTTTVSIQEAYESTQLYVYEYTEDLDITERPRQVVPHAVVSFRFAGTGSSQQKSATAKKVWLPSEYASRQTSSKMSPVAESALAVNSSLSKRSSTDSVLPATPQKGSSVQGGEQVAKNVMNDMSAGSDAADSGDIIWTGQLCMESAVISDVELVSYSNFNLPWHLEPWLNLDHDRIGYDEIMSYYQLELLAILPRDQECRASGKFYNYCELRPMTQMSKNFLRAVYLISKSRCGSRIKLTKGVDLIILPHCTITYQLGLCSRRPERVVLHCIIISTMSSSYQQGIMSKPLEAANQSSNEFPFNSQVLESGVDVTSNMRPVPYQENIASSHSVRQSLQFMQSYPGIPPNEQALLQRGQHGSIPFSPFPATTPGEAVHPLGLSSTADVPFSLSKQRHYDPRLARRLEMQSEFLPHISSDDVLRLNLPASDLPSALQTNAREGSVPGAEQSTLGSGSRHDSLQERIDRMQAELEARGSPLGYYQSDADTETEYSPSSRFPPRGSSSSVSEEDEELELDIIKLRRPTALGQLEKNTDEEQTNEEAMEVDEGNMADDLVDEIVRMKPLQAKAARETFGGPEQSSDGRQGKVTDGEPMESISLTDCLFIDFDVEVSSSDSEETTDNSKTNADDLAVIKSSLLTSSATETVHNVVDDAAVVAKPVEDVTIQKDGLSSDSSKPAKPVEPVKISEEHPSPKEVPEILSPISCDVRSNDNSKVPVLSVDVASSPRPAEENDLSSKSAAADEVVNSEGLVSAVQPETCLDESSEVVSEGSRTVTFVETGKLSIEIHSDVPAKSTSDETVAEVLQVATSSPAPAPEEETRLVIEEEQVVSCVAKVLHRGARRRRLPVTASKEEEEADHRMEMIWQLGLHYLAFFIDRDDDDNREIDAEEVPNIRSMTEHTNTFVSMFSKESMQESNKSKHVGLSSGAFVPGVFPATNKLNRGQQFGVSSSKCTTDVVRPKASLIVPSRHQTGRPDNQHESILSNQGLSKNFNGQNESEIRELQLLTNRINRFAPNELPAHHSSELQAGLLNPDFVVHRISELQINTRRRDLKAAKLMKICNSSPDACTGESALGALQRDQVDSSATRNFLRSPQRHLPVPSLLRNYRGRVEDQHKSFSFEVQSDSSRSSANEDRHVSSMSQDRRAQSKDQHSTMQRDQFLPRSQDHRDVQDSTLRPLSRSQDRQSLSGDRFSTTHRDKSLSRSRDFGGEFSGRYSVMPRDRSASRSQSRRDRDSVVRRGRSFSRSRSRSTVASSRRTPVSYRNQASLIPKTDPYNAGEMTSSRSYRSASRSVSRLRRSRSRSPSRRAYSIASRSRSRSVHRRRKRHRRRGRRSSKPKRDRRRRDSRSRSLLSRYSSDSRNRSVSYDRNRSRRTSYSSSSDTGRRNCFRSGLSKKRRSRSISSSRQDSSYRCGPSSYYDDEPCYRNRTSDYRFRDDRERAHPYYYRRQDGTRARIDREDFLKVYREHRDLEELLQCLTKGQFESRRTRPILTHLTSNPLATVSMQSSPRFKSGFFQRSTFLEADDILGRREKVVDCLEDEMYSRDQVPNFYEKKAMADAFDDNFRPAATESQMSQRRSSSVVSNSPKITSSAAEPETAAEGSSDAKSGKAAQMS